MLIQNKLTIQELDCHANVANHSSYSRGFSKKYSSSKVFESHKEQTALNKLVSSNEYTNIFLTIIHRNYLNINNFKELKINTLFMLDDIKKKIDLDQELRPVRFLGIRADYTVISQIAALIGTAIFAILSNIYKKLNIDDIIKT